MALNKVKWWMIDTEDQAVDLDEIRTNITTLAAEQVKTTDRVTIIEEMIANGDLGGGGSSTPTVANKLMSVETLPENPDPETYYFIQTNV